MKNAYLKVAWTTKPLDCGVGVLRSSGHVMSSRKDRPLSVSPDQLTWSLGEDQTHPAMGKRCVQDILTRTVSERRTTWPMCLGSVLGIGQLQGEMGVFIHRWGEELLRKTERQ